MIRFSKSWLSNNPWPLLLALVGLMVRLTLAGALFLGCTDVSAPKAPGYRAPHLLLFIVVDQFRADYLLRYQSELLPAHQADGDLGGFRYLMDQGAYVPLARHDVLQAMTGPGHATLASGAYPYRNGVPINQWYDFRLGEPMYCVRDDSQVVLGAQGSEGRSPKNLLGSTIGDEIKNTGNGSRVVSISIKDRAAVLMGGRRADAALWFDKKTFQWTTSRFYANEAVLPSWVSPLNETLQKQKGQPYTWASRPGACRFSDEGEDSFNTTLTLGEKSSINSPYGNEITMAMVDAALDHYKLGQQDRLDALFVSFSSHDTLGHQRGPNRCEMEELTLDMDRRLSALFNRLAEHLPRGMEDVLVVVTGDHGVSPAPSYLSANRVDARWLNAEALKERLEQGLVSRFGEPIGGAWISYTSDFNYFLNHPAITQLGVSENAVEDALKEMLVKQEDFLLAFSANDVRLRQLPGGQWERQILHSYFPGRSGDVVAIPKPYVMNDEYPTTHMTGYTYDTTVPLILSGPGLVHGRYATEVEVVDIAPTLAFLLHTLPPNLAEGRVLSEMVRIEP